MQRTLLLTSWFLPHRVLCWQDAVTLLYLDKAERVVDYGETVSSPSTTILLPAVIRLRNKVAGTKRRVKFSRVNVFTRDGFRCQYCGHKHPMGSLTYDHVQPRRQGGRTVWNNIVASCRPCNSRKGGRTPQQAGMAPLTSPQRPKSLPITAPMIDVAGAPREWRDFLITRV